MADKPADKEPFSLSSDPIKAVRDIIQARRDGLVSDGDLATVLIAVPIGAAGDLALHLTGIVSPGWCAMGLASAGLGIKRWFHAEKKRRDDKKILALPGPPQLSTEEQLRLDTIKISHALLARLKEATLNDAAATPEHDRLAAEISFADDPLLFDAATLKKANERAKNYLRSVDGLDLG